MGLMRRVKNFVSEKYAALVLRLELMRDKLNDYFGVHVDEQVNRQYSGEEAVFAISTGKLLNKHFGDTPGKTLLSEDLDSRIDALEGFAEELKGIYGMREIEVEFTDDDEVFPVTDPVYTFGQTDNINVIQINTRILAMDDPDLLDHMVLTMVHEFRHCIQASAVLRLETYGVPYKKRRLWRQNMRNRINSGEDFEGYYKQATEEDARNFSLLAWRIAHDMGASEEEAK